MAPSERHGIRQWRHLKPMMLRGTGTERTLSSFALSRSPAVKLPEIHRDTTKLPCSDPWTRSPDRAD